MRKLAFISFLALSACASPAIHMSDQEVISLSDDQLCEYHNNYRSHSRTETEIARRGLNCDRFFRECLRRGNKPGTEPMEFCMDLLRENERLRYDPPYDRFGFGLYGIHDYDRLRSVRH
jgi:hypothetical protein